MRTDLPPLRDNVLLKKTATYTTVNFLAHTSTIPSLLGS